MTMPDTKFFEETVLEKIAMEIVMLNSIEFSNINQITFLGRTKMLRSIFAYLTLNFCSIFAYLTLNLTETKIFLGGFPVCRIAISKFNSFWKNVLGRGVSNISVLTRPEKC